MSVLDRLPEAEARITVLRYPNRRGAERALRRIADAVAERVFDIRGAVLIHVGRRGTPWVRHGLPPTTAQNAELRLLTTCALFGVAAQFDLEDIDGPPLGKVPKDIVSGVAEILAPTTTAVVLLVAEPFVLTLAELVRGPGARVVSTTLNETDAALLRAALAGPGRA